MSGSKCADNETPCPTPATGTATTIPATLNTAAGGTTSTFNTSIISPTTASIPTPSTSTANSPTTTSAANSITSAPVASTTGTAPVASTTGAVPTSNGVSNAAAAGIAIGCFLVGAVVAGLVVFFLLRRRKRQQSFYPQQHLPASGGGYVEGEKHGMRATTTAVAPGVVTNVDRLLPQPAEDDEVVGGLSKIRDAIKNHAQNYYHSAAVNPKVVDEAGLVDLASATGIPASALRDLLLSPATRMATIKVFLAHLLLSKCGAGTGRKGSFLPDEVSLLAASPREASGTNSFQAALFSKWKVISGALLQQQYGQQITENDPRYGSISQALAAAEPVLHPFLNPSVDMNARRRNFESIARRVAQFAFLLFSQPGSFQFDYSGTGQPHSLVVFPALLQTVSDAAEPLLPPRVLSAKEVASDLQ